MKVVFLDITEIPQNGPTLNANCYQTTKIPYLKFLKDVKSMMTEIFFHISKHYSFILFILDHHNNSKCMVTQ